MAGAVSNPKRVRYQAQERFDTSDADADSRATRDHMKAWDRAFLSTPRAAGGAAMPGVIIAGFELTLNPTGGTDNKVRVSTNIGVCLDSDGNLIIKPAGTVDITLPAGSRQLYAYFIEQQTDDAKRRFLSVNAPYVESTDTIKTTLQGDCGFYVRSGNNTNTVAEDTVLGVTTPLCCIGILTNTAGTITCTGYNATTAPNGSDITNRLVTATPAGTAPTVNTRNGSIASLHEMVQVLAHQIGQIGWKGSAGLTPAAANNYGAYNVPAGGVDAAFRGATGYITIGNGTTVVGDFNQSDYANNKLLLEAAMAGLPANGGRIIIKKGVQLSGFAGTSVVVPGSKSIEIVGDHYYGVSTPSIIFAANEFIDATGALQFSLRNCWIQWVTKAVQLGTGGFIFEDITFNKNSSTDTGAAIMSSLQLDGVHFRNLVFAQDLSAQTNNAMAIRIAAACSRVKFDNIQIINLGTDGGGIQITNVRDEVYFDRIMFRTGGGGVVGGTTAAAIMLDTTDNTTNMRGRMISRFSSTVPLIRGIDFGNCGWLTIADSVIQSTVGALYSSAYAGAGQIKVNGCRVASMSLVGAFPAIRFYDCDFIPTTAVSMTIGAVGSVQGTIEFVSCRYSSTVAITTSLLCNALTIEQFIVNGCSFSGNNSTTVADWGVVKLVAATSADIVTLNENKAWNIQNVAYGGADATSCPRIFEVDIGNAGGGGGVVTCSDNQIWNIMNTSSGNARKGVYLLDVDSNDRSANGSIVGQVVMNNNKVGRRPFGGTIPQFAQDYVMLLRTIRHTVMAIHVDDNELVTYWNTTAGFPTLDHIVNSATISLTSASLFSFQNNTVFIRQPSTVNVDLFRVTGGTADFTELSFSDNQIVLSDAFSWNFATAWGANWSGYGTGGVINLVVQGNSCTVQSDTAATARFETKGTATRNQTGAAVPGAGVAWAQNNLIFGG